MKALLPKQPDGLPRCKGCGACCFMDYGGVFLVPKDVKRLPPEFVRYNSRLKTVVTEPFGEHCIAFDPVKRVCTIYENRPNKCRNFSRGGHLCKQYVRGLKERLQRPEKANSK